MHDEFFSKAHELSRGDQPFATATVVRAEKPTSGKPGDKAIITLDGVMYGWIGGSCAQPAVVEVARAAILEDRGRLIRLTPNPGSSPLPEGLEEVAMTCYSGGTLDVYIEPQQPRPNLLIVGNLPVAQALAHLGKAMSYRVIAVDPDGDGKAMVHADEILTDFAEVAPRITPLTYAVVATHGHFDEEALVHLLRTPAPYVGLIASRKRADSIRTDLADAGIHEAAFARLHAPAGLDIQAQRGDEIALSIMAQIVQVRRNTAQLEWHAANDAEPAKKAAASSCCGGSALETGEAIDPGAA